MAGSLDGPRLKLERAQVHLKELDAELDAFGKLQAERVRIQRYSKTRRIEWFIENPEQPRETWGPIIGDCLHNMRSALDHLAGQLVIANGKKPGRDTAFPFYGSRQQFLCESPKKTRGMAPRIVAALESAQSYRVGGHFPSLLNRLSNVDKHQHFHLVINSIETGGLRGWPDSLQLYAGPIGEGRTVLLSGIIPKPEVPMEYEPFFDVTFAEGPARGWGLSFILRACFDATVSLVRGLGHLAGLDGSVDRLIWPEGLPTG